MVLDAKLMTWASQNSIDTAKLKAAKVPIYGKWYFPVVPANLPVVNLETGERQTFEERMIAGEILWVAEADLRRHKIGPFAGASAEVDGPGDSPAVTATAPRRPLEPLLAMSRPPTVVPGVHDREPQHAIATTNDDEAIEVATPAVTETDDVLAPVHESLPSIAPFVFGVGLSIMLLGLITNVIVLFVGLIWMLAGSVAWIRIGVLEARHGAHEATT